MKCAEKEVSRYRLWLIVLLALGGIVSCAPEKQYHILSFFFDGVPDPNAKVVSTSDSSAVDTTAVVASNVKPEFIEHKPYAEEKCKSCHQEGFSTALIKPVPVLCFSCHEDFSQKSKILHGPVAAGACLTCHDQHMTKYEKLLTRPGQEVCLYCHNSVDIRKNKMHEKIEDKACTECHDPHGGENSGFLNQTSCYQCHEDFNSKFSLLHGPVASGNCSICHSSHASKTPKFLSRVSQQVCLYCHDQEMVFATEAHKKVRKNNCTTCHNPHGGEDQNFLVQALIPVKKKILELKPENEIKMDSLPEIKDENNSQNDTILKKPERRNY